MSKEELLEFPGFRGRVAAQRDLSRQTRERPRNHRPHRGQDAQEPHPRAGGRQGPGGDDALRPDQGPDHLPFQVKLRLRGGSDDGPDAPRNRVRASCWRPVRRAGSTLLAQIGVRPRGDPALGDRRNPAPRRDAARARSAAGDGKGASLGGNRAEARRSRALSDARGRYGGLRRPADFAEVRGA